jgi:hypothetical protein
LPYRSFVRPEACLLCPAPGSHVQTRQGDEDPISFSLGQKPCDLGLTLAGTSPVPLDVVPFEKDVETVMDETGEFSPLIFEMERV